MAHPGATGLPGVEVPERAERSPRFAVDLDAVPAEVHQVNLLLALPVGAGGPDRFGVTAAPFVAVMAKDGSELASFTITGLDTETALVAVELYRRQGAWKVRAVGQGYAGGLAQLLADQGMAQADRTAAAIQETAVPRAHRAEPARLHTAADAAGAASGPDQPSPADATLTGGLAAPQPAGADPAPQTPTPDAPQMPGGPINYAHPRRQSAPPPPAPTAQPAEPGRPPTPVAGDASGWSMEERLYNQVWGMFEDLARAVAAYRSAVEFAESRMDKELDSVLSDPRSRIGSTGDAARAAARAKCEQLTDQARQVLDRDLAQLAAESEVVEPALPPAFARWDNPCWHAYRVPMEIPMALRLGDLHLPESPELRIPCLVRLPLERGLWVDSGRSSSDAAMAVDEARLRRLAVDSAVALAARLLAVYPPGEFTVHAIDPAGSAAASLAPLVESGALAGPPAAGAQGVSAVLAKLTERVDLVTMAVRGGAADSLPPISTPASNC